jgi:hypothetical protein
MKRDSHRGRARFPTPLDSVATAAAGLQYINRRTRVADEWWNRATYASWLCAAVKTAAFYRKAPIAVRPGRS